MKEAVIKDIRNLLNYDDRMINFSKSSDYFHD